jgi:hypothetical protein
LVGVTPSIAHPDRRTFMAKTLANLTIARSGEDYLITFEDADGTTSELIADYDQLDMISEAIDEALNSDEEEALEPDEAEDEVED